MSKRFWKRLAGCIVIKCALAATPEYRTGTAVAGTVRAVAIKDRKGGRAVFADAGFPITRAISDRVAAQLAKEYSLDRGSMVLGGKGSEEARPEDLFTAIAAALGAMTAAKVTYNGVLISITTMDGKCLATIPSGPCGGGAAVAGPIRTAFQIVELPHPLQQRGESSLSYPVQAVALGKSVTVIALSGDGRYAGGTGVLVVSHANDVVTAVDPERAILQVLARVRR